MWPVLLRRDPSALIDAFARVRHENFVGFGPWKVASVDGGLSSTTYTDTNDCDPRHLCHNVPVALDAARDSTMVSPQLWPNG